jgi:primosomal protein N' (replication factor Y)
VSKFAEVVVGSFTGDAEGSNIYDYKIPQKLEDIIESGMRVVVPFGKRMLEGYVVGVKDSTVIDDSRLKPIDSIPDLSHVFNSNVIFLARWMAEEYMCSLTDTLQCILPSEMVMKENRFITLNKIDEDEILRLNCYQKSIIDAVKSSGGAIEIKKISKLGFDI